MIRKAISIQILVAIRIEVIEAVVGKAMRKKQGISKIRQDGGGRP